jgi:hypothetical protein
MFITRLDENKMDEKTPTWMKFLQINNIKPPKFETFLIKNVIGLDWCQNYLDPLYSIKK